VKKSINGDKATLNEDKMSFAKILVEVLVEGHLPKEVERIQ